MGVKVRERPAGSGVWWIFIDHQGKRKAKKVGDKKTAIEAAKKIEARLTLGDVGIVEKGKTPVFKEYAEQWLATYGATQLKYSTAESYASDLKNHICPFFGDKRLDQIKKTDVKQFIYERQQAGLSTSSVRNLLACFSSIINNALDDELILINPAQRLFKLVPKRDRKADFNPLTREEAQAFLNAVQEHYPRYYPFFLCAVRTGMRLGELLALEWGAIDFYGRFIVVKQSVSRHRLTTPKNKRTHKVDMSQQLAMVLKEHRQIMRKEALRNGRPVSERIFVQPNGKPLTATSIADRTFKRCLDKAGLRRIRFHDLRHGFASMLVSQGESLAYVKEQMGHHSIQITVDLYAHLAPEGKKDAVDRLDDPEWQEKQPNATYPQPGEKKDQQSKNGAGNGIRTRDFNLGKVALYH